MDVRVYGKNLKISPQVESHVREELKNLEKFIEKRFISESKIEVGITSFHHRKGDIYRAEINLRLPGKLLRAEEEAESIHTAINIVKEELERQIKKYRGKREIGKD